MIVKLITSVNIRIFELPLSIQTFSFVKTQNGVAQLLEIKIEIIQIFNIFQ